MILKEVIYMYNYPAMTYYARVLDNVTNQEIISSTDTTQNNTWYYGKCNGLEGGESQYIVEFDIWNNEVGLNAGDRAIPVKDAINCRLEVWPDVSMKRHNNNLFNMQDPFMYARCITKDLHEPFSGIKYTNALNSIVGNVNGRTGIIQGVGDHSIIQTKIKMPVNSGVSTSRCSFVFAFLYDFD
jgi:hypothetical protein